MNDSEIKTSFAEYDRQTTIQNSRLGAFLASLMMPAGSFTMDYFVYRAHLGEFFWLRILSGILTAAVFGLLYTSRGVRFYRVLSVVWYWIPMIIIAGLIVRANDPISPYYAGFNLVLIGVGLILPWAYRETLVTVVLVIALYVGLYFAAGDDRNPIYLANNLFFLCCTGTIVVCGNIVHSRRRYREFVMRYELEISRKTIQENNQKLVELDQIKGRFFANISHELRTPLTLMISPLETILARYRNSLDPAAVNLLHTMQSNGLRLLKLINDLLDLVRLESGVMEVRREPVALDVFLQGLASAARQVATDKQIDLQVNVAPEVGAVMVDRDKLEKIVINLQFNALKFTPSGGRVELRVDKEAEDLVLRVSDTGIGIPEKDMPKMFSRFFQVDSSSRRKYQGVGIGLALVKEFTELHGGTVSVSSVEGKGTTFTVRMPYMKADPAATPRDYAIAQNAAPSPESSASPTTSPASSATNSNSNSNSSGSGGGGTVSSQEWLSNLYHRANLFGGAAADKLAPPRAVPASNGAHTFTALVADDQPDMLQFICSELAPHYNIVRVTDGQQAVDRAAECIPDIILLDMMMPEKDGIQACREIRAAEATHSVPIILITAHVDEETKLTALRAGASDFLPKPFSTTELHVRVRNLVESYDFQRKLARQNHALTSTIEQLKATESQLVQSEKLASLGRLSAGIIHEINNPLNYVTTGLFTLRAKARLIPDPEREDYAEILKDIEDGVVRVKTIVTDLRTFTHPGASSADEVKATEVVSSVLRFVSQEWKDKVDMRIDVPEDQAIWADRNRLIQVVLNLVQNSLDAVLSKKFSSAEERPAIEIRGWQRDGFSRLAVRDNGDGIAPDVMDKIFDPFFTTKDVGKGMGLGLSICYRIVQDFGGRISVASEPGKYCEFTLEFPMNRPERVLQP